jgi:hypothetical protein
MERDAPSLLVEGHGPAVAAESESFDEPVVQANLGRMRNRMRS